MQSLRLKVGRARHGVIVYCKIRCKCLPETFSFGCSNRLAYWKTKTKFELVVSISIDNSSTWLMQKIIVRLKNHHFRTFWQRPKISFWWFNSCMCRIHNRNSELKNDKMSPKNKRKNKIKTPQSLDASFDRLGPLTYLSIGAPHPNRTHCMCAVGASTKFIWKIYSKHTDTITCNTYNFASTFVVGTGAEHIERSLNLHSSFDRAV